MSIAEKADAYIGLMHGLCVGTTVYNKIGRGVFPFLSSLSHNVRAYQLIFEFLTGALEIPFLIIAKLCHLIAHDFPSSTLQAE
jgi:hypothetical protein